MSDNRAYMQRAIELAKQGVGKVNPNPLVGAVIVKDGEIISEGYHRVYGDLHAEVYCKSEEAKHRKPRLTYSDLKAIIEETRVLYPHFKWRNRK